MAAKRKPQPRRVKVKFPPGYLDRARRTIGAAAAANRLPCPGPLLAAFTEPQLTRHGVTLRPVVASDWPALQELDSPLLKNFLEQAKPAAERVTHKSTEAEVYEAIYLFMVSPAQARADRARGRDFYREQAVTHVGDRLHTAAVLELSRLLGTRIIDYWATAVGYGARADSGGAQVFTTPPAAKTG